MNVINKNVSIILLMIGLSMILNQPCLASIEASNRYEAIRPAIIQLSDDRTVVKTVNDLKTSIGKARVINPISKDELVAIEKRIHNEIFIVGHGDREGIKICTSKLKWNELREIIDQSPSFKHYILACYSSDIESHPKIIRTFNGLIDADIALTVCKATREIIFVSQKAQMTTERSVGKIFPLKNPIEEIVKSYQIQILELWVNKIQNNDFQFLTIGWYRGLWWDRYPGTVSRPVLYDHLDRDYYGINPYSVYTRNGNNFEARQDPPSVGDLYSFLLTIFIWIVGAVLGGLFVAAGVPIIGVIVSFLLMLLGVAAGQLLDWFLRDELGSIWNYVKDRKLHKIWFVPYAYSFYWKMGKVWWLGITLYVANPVVPLIVPCFDIPMEQVTNW